MTADRVWKLYAASDGSRTGLINSYFAAQFVSRVNAVGSWALAIPAGDQADLLRDDGAEIEFECNGTVMFSGPVLEKSHRVTTDSDEWGFSGADHMVWLESRLAYYDPSSEVSSAWSASETDSHTGIASTVIYELIDENIGPSAISARQVPDVTLAADPLTGATVTGVGEMNSILSVVAPIAEDNGLIITVNDREFSIAPAPDKTASVLFSTGLRNMAAYTHVEKAPRANFTAVKYNASYRTAMDSASIVEWGRHEYFTQAGQRKQLQRAANDALVENGSSIAIALTPVDTDQFSYPDTWDVGDKVSVEVSGETFEETIREVAVALSGDGDVITPGLGGLVAVTPTGKPRRNPRASHTTRTAQSRRPAPYDNQWIIDLFNSEGLDADQTIYAQTDYSGNTIGGRSSPPPEPYSFIRHVQRNQQRAQALEAKE